MERIFSPIKQRLMQYVDLKGITKENFFKNIQITAANFKGVGAKSELGGDKIARILSIYTDINPEWLLTGNGQMLKAITKTVEEPNTGQTIPAKADELAEMKILDL